MIIDFGGAIEQQISGMEGCYVADRYVWILSGRTGVGGRIYFIKAWKKQYKVYKAVM